MTRVKKARLAKAFKEVHENPPAIVRHTQQKFGAARAEKQRVAIALSKARGGRPKLPKPNNPISPGIRLVEGDTRRGYRRIG